MGLFWSSKSNYSITQEAAKTMAEVEVAPPVVTSEWLKDKLDHNDQHIRVLDATWSSVQDSHQGFLEKHIPGSSWFDIMHQVKQTSLFPRNLPEQSAFEKYVRSFGINHNTRVVLYDSTPENGFFTAGRAWWMFKLHGHEHVSVLDGGLTKWIQLGLPTTSVILKFEKGNFTVKYKHCLIKKYEDMQSALKNSCVQVCDTRPEAKYKGSALDPKLGHYPGAKSLTLATKLLDQDKGTLKSAEELKQVFAEAGVDLSRPVVGMCNSGMSSCTLALAATLCGADDVSVYHGGFTEWSNKADTSQIEA